MANAIAPRGLRPVRHLNGSPWNGQTEAFLIDSGNNTAVFVGDIVKQAGSAGVAGQVVNGMDVEGMATVILAAGGTSGADIVGVVVGFLPDPTALGTKHRLASTSRIALVCTDPSVVYEVQEDAVGGNFDADDIGLLVAFTTTAGNSTTGISKMALDSSDLTATSGYPLKLLGLSKRVGNAFGLSTTDAGWFEVMFNTGVRMPNVVGA
jgi:hypothetical protein